MMQPKRCSVDECDHKYYALGWCEMHWRRVRKHGNPHSGRNHAPAAERFERYVERGPDCWLWLGKKERNGYGRFQVGGKGSPFVGAHRFAWMRATGRKIPTGMVVMHACDNPACVNPAHLSVGSCRDNTADMIAKGRGNGIGPGVANRNAKANDAVVREIRATPSGTRGLTKKYGLNKTTIANMRKRKTWRHVK